MLQPIAAQKGASSATIVHRSLNRSTHLKNFLWPKQLLNIHPSINFAIFLTFRPQKSVH
jgi:hypothetical protein